MAHQQRRSGSRRGSRAQVNREQLPRPDWSLKVVPPYAAPRSKLEREVQLLWQTVLNQPAMISVEADFTQQGGGMMHAVVVNGIIRHAPGRRHVIWRTLSIT